MLTTCLALGATLALAACGGDDGESLTVGTDELSSLVDDVCVEAALELEELEQPQSRQQLTEALQRSLPVQEQQLEDLRTIEPAAAQMERYDEAIGLVEAQVAVFQDAIAELEAGVQEDAVADELRIGLESSAERLNRLVESLGLPSCSP